MRIAAKRLHFLAFTVIFAALAGFVFWGTWSLDVVPVMPDAQTTYPTDFAWRSWRKMLESGKFIHLDVINLVGSPYFWQELKFVLSLYLAALGMAYFCRGRGLSRISSYGAGLLLAFSGYWMTLYSAGHLGWFLWMAYGVFAFGLVDRAVEKGTLRHWLLLGATVSWASFNQQDLWLLFTAFTAVYFVYRCIVARQLPWKGALIAALTFAIVGLPNFSDTIANTLKGRKEQISRGENITDKNASERDRQWEFVTNWSMPPEDTFEFFNSRVHGDTSCPFVLSIGNGLGTGVRPYEGALGRPMNASAGNYRQHSLYVGWVTCLLALCGVMLGWRKCWFFVIAAALFYMLSLGRYLEVVYRVVFLLPFGDLIRCPVKWHHLTEFCLVVIAAHGIDCLMEKTRNFRFAKYVIMLLVLLGAIDLARNDRLYCAPVSVREARRTNSFMQMSVLRRQDFSNPQIVDMVNRRQIVSIANYLGSPDLYLVGVLQRFDDAKTAEISGFACIFGLLSLIATIGITIYSIFVVSRHQNMV